MRREAHRGDVNVIRSASVVSHRTPGRPLVARFASEQKLRLFSKYPLQHVSICIVEVETSYPLHSQLC